jgi:SAM-dependent methyltransferase
MVQHHMDLEYRLTQTLLSSLPEDRPKVWASSYDQLYRDLPWLAASSASNKGGEEANYRHLLKLIPVGSRVIEIGSGAGSLAIYLNKAGRSCVATEITSERGVRDAGGVSWHNTDGVHLAEFESAASYDYVLSMQVIEHLHPEDVETHFRGALALLRPSGQYLFTTPHAFFGPADLSAVFSLDRPHFMHLKEYTHRELGAIARRAGFHTVEAVYLPPLAIRRILPFVVHSRWLYRYLRPVEAVCSRFRVPHSILRALLFHRDVFLIATK